LAEKDEAGKWLNAKVGKQKTSARMQEDHLHLRKQFQPVEKGDQNVT